MPGCELIGAASIHGHAIVSDDDRIAAADGTVPMALRNAADWARFQARLDDAAVTVLGRKGHEANPNRKHRNRLVVSSSARGVERREDAWWWNPAQATVETAFSWAAPTAGVAAVVGGRRVFDLFLHVGFDEFHLTRARGFSIVGGIAVFSAIHNGLSAEDVLARHGLVAGPSADLDTAAGVSLVVWRRQDAQP